MQLEVLGDRCVDRFQEAQELLVAVAAVVLRYDRPGGDVQGRDAGAVRFLTQPFNTRSSSSDSTTGNGFGPGITPPYNRQRNHDSAH